MSLEKFCYMKRIVQFSVLVCFFIGFNLSCFTSEQDGAGGKLPVPDYAQSEMWYRSLEGAANKAVDVFYITPTCIWDWKDQSGQTVHYMDVTNSVQRSLVDGSNALAYALFEKSCNSYSPYYRQITMNSWFESEEVINERYAVAHQDVVRAFKYYLEHYNNGRPFILAGHSQGAKAVIELLKHSVTPEQYQRMVAAYAFGFSVGSNELAQSPLLKPASGADDIGALVLFNSVSKPEACSPLFANNVVCINPVNWTVDGTYAPASENPGSVFFDSEGHADTLFHAVGVGMTNDRHTLLIDGLSDDDYYIPSIEQLFPKGNYHVQELNLYFLSVQRNIANRIDRYNSSHKNE